MRKKIFMVLSMLFVFLLVGCNTTLNKTDIPSDNPKYMDLYNLGVDAGIVVESYEEWLETIKGKDGQEVLFQVDEEFIQWKHEDSKEWNNLYPIMDLVGKDGTDGREILFQVDEGFIKWQYKGDSFWSNLIEIATLTGKEGLDGREVRFNVAEGFIQWQYKGDSLWSNLISLDLLKGQDGINGADGKSAYEIYLDAFPDYTGSELDWINDLINGNLAKKEQYIVTFDYNDDLVDNDIKNYEKGSKIEKPLAPKKEGFVFKGWFNNDKIWDFDRYIVDKNVTIKARWNPVIVLQEELVIHVNLEDEVSLPKQVAVKDFFGKSIKVDVKWDLTKYYAKDLGIDYVYGLVCDTNFEVKIKIHIHDASYENNIVTGYVSGHTNGKSPVAILSNEYDAYHTMPDNTGYYLLDYIQEGKYMLRIELDGYVINEPVEVIFKNNKENISKDALLMTNRDINKVDKINESLVVVDFELIEFKPGHFSYKWRYGGSYFGYEQTANIVKPPVINFHDKELVTNDTSASLKLIDDYQVYLSDSDIKWNSEYSSRLLDMFSRVPSISAIRKDSMWVVTKDHMYKDLTIEDMGEYNLVTISVDAFKNATPKLADVDGVTGKYYSNRLYHAVVRYLTNEGNDLEAIDYIFRTRFGVSVIINNYEDIIVYSKEEENSSHYQMFKPEELLSLLSMFEEMPEGMHKIDGLKYLLRRVDGGKNPTHPAAPAIAWSSHNYIEFMEIAFTTVSENYLNRLIIHEKSHFLWEYTFNQDIKDKWIELGGWYHTPGTASGWATTKTTEFVSAYAHLKNPNEDMAESISYYLIQPEKLRARSMGKYNFIKDYIMHGTRYLTEIREDLTFEVYNLFPDYDYPGKINSISIDVYGAPEEDKRVVFEIGLNNQEGLFDGSSGGIMRVYSELETYYDVHINPTDETGQVLRGEIIISKYAKSGYWKTDQIKIKDSAGNERFEGFNQFGWKLYIDNPLEDITPPEYVDNSLEVDIKEIVMENKPVYQVDISFEVIEENMKINNGGYISLKGPNEESGSLNKWGTYDHITNKVVVTHYLTDFHPNGEYYITSLTLQDKAENRKGYNFPILATGEKPTTFILDSKNEDLDAPTLNENTITIDAEPTNKTSPDGETIVTINIDVKDNASGLDYGSFSLKDPQGNSYFEYFYPDSYREIFFKGDPTKEERYIITIILPRGSAPGIWGLQEIMLRDLSGNMRIYNFEEVIIFDVIE